MLRENANFPRREGELLAGREPVRLPGPKKLGMWVFIAADGAAFLAILAACGYIRVASTRWPRPFLWWPDATIAALMSVILLAGSGSAFAATRAIHRGECGKAARWLAAAAAGGLLFGIAQWGRWSDMIHRGARLDRNPWGTSLFGASFFTLTGFHLIHVVVGIFYLAGLARSASRGRASAEDVETGAIYWHFVVVMGLAIFLVFVLFSDGRASRI